MTLKVIVYLRFFRPRTRLIIYLESDVLILSIGPDLHLYYCISYYFESLNAPLPLCPRHYIIGSGVTDWLVSTIVLFFVRNILVFMTCFFPLLFPNVPFYATLYVTGSLYIFSLLKSSRQFNKLEGINSWWSQDYWILIELFVYYLVLGSPITTVASSPSVQGRLLFSNVARMGFAAACDSPSLNIQETATVADIGRTSSSNGPNGTLLQTTAILHIRYACIVGNHHNGSCYEALPLC